MHIFLKFLHDSWTHREYIQHYGPLNKIVCLLSNIITLATADSIHLRPIPLPYHYHLEITLPLIRKYCWSLCTFFMVLFAIFCFSTACFYFFFLTILFWVFPSLLYIRNVFISFRDLTTDISNFSRNIKVPVCSIDPHRFCIYILLFVSSTYVSVL